MIIGGFTSIAWKTPVHDDPYHEDFITDNDAYLFSVTRQKKFNAIRGSNKAHCDATLYCVAFGYDLFINRWGKASSQNLYESFEAPPGSGNELHDKKWFMGSNTGNFNGSFEYAEFEVF